MRTEAHVSVARAEVRGRPLFRHAVVRSLGGRAYGAAFGLGWPRMWSYANENALEGYRSAIEGSSARGADRLVAAFTEARRCLVHACEQLVEREAPDCAFLGMLLDAGSLHVVSAGPARVYLHRGTETLRLLPKEDGTAGILTAEPLRSSTVLDVGDLVLAGSISAFSERSIEQVQAVLASDPHTPSAVLGNLLTDPASRAGVGAAAVVLRVG